MATSAPREFVIGDGATLPAGVAQVASPRQKVVAEAPVPLFRFETPIVLFVKVSVVLRPTKVSVAAGIVRRPDATAADCKVVQPLVVPKKASLVPLAPDQELQVPPSISAVPAPRIWP